MNKNARRRVFFVQSVKYEKLDFGVKTYISLRSTKWNASLILACDSAELVALCKEPTFL